MRALAIVGLLSLAVTASAFGAGTVKWSISLDPLSVDANANPRPAIKWAASVVVSTDTKGLANYNCKLEVRDSAGQLVNVTLPTANFTQSFNVGGKGPADVKAVATSGGIGYTGPSFPGNNTSPGAGVLDGFSAGYGLPYDVPSMTWGVGLDSRKSVLLANPNGTFVLNDGEIPTDGLAEGTYTVTLSCTAAGVLKFYKGTTTTPINYETDQTGLPSDTSTTKIGASATFEIVPEPATILLIAGAAIAGLRRRHA